MLDVLIPALFKRAELRTTVDTKSSALPTGQTLSGSVLVVDDENGPRQALRMLLKEFYDIYLACDVAEALKIVEQKEIDVIITDLRMPRQTGVDLLRQVKAQNQDIQVIILTGYGQLETAVKAVEYGAFAYIEKPFDNDAFLKQVDAALSKRRQDYERRSLEKLALEANRFETVGRVVSGMIHDLGTPLSVIGSHIEMMIHHPNKGDIDSRLQVMLSQVHHCGDIVRTTMSFLRNQADVNASFNLNNVLDACIEVGRPFLHQQGVSVRRDLSSELGHCKGDFTLVCQAILNLITNACQAMDHQAEPKEILIRSWTEGPHVCLSVQDTGRGIPVENRQKVFDTFYSTKGDKGTGLGLAVVRNVMQRHGGEVVLGDSGGRGSLFILRFPVFDPEPAKES
ncbi:MAG: hybrid sensor histidine kinase/response regulator [Candidatus Hydrogenedentes bacterium]|nr:hybrid sensor histidine kinase/response regulator [Candidatus Hydrogenedentota bacterium]